MPELWALDLMRAACILLALLVASCATSERVSQAGWTKRTVSGLTIKLVDDPTKIEWLDFGRGGIVLTTWGRAWVSKSGDRYRMTTNPGLTWKFVDGHVLIYEDGHVAEDLSFVRRDGSFLILRMKSGKIGRFKILDEQV